MSVTNATLTEIRSAAPVNDYGDVASDMGDGAPLKWSGSRACYLTTRTKSIEVAGVRKSVKVDMLIVHGTLPVEVIGGEPANGDTVLVNDARPLASAQRWRVVGVDVRSTGSIADSVRLELAVIA